jgi:hypothetical protein
MFVRHLISPVNRLFLLGMLLLTLLTTALSLSQDTRYTQAPEDAPMSLEVADGWSDPVGG